MAEFAGSVPPSDGNFPGYLAEFRSKVDFLKSLAKSNWVDAPESLQSSQKMKLRQFYGLDAALEAGLEALMRAPEASEENYAKIAIFLYLESKVEELGAAALKLNKRGLYDLVDSVSEWAHGFLSDRFFRKPLAAIVKEYMQNEPQLAACAELCGVDLISIQDATAANRKMAADLMRNRGR